MPQLDGITLCEKIKNDPKTKDIPVLFLSALSDTTTITKAFEVGAVDYITKPFNGLELIARVNTHIELRRYIKEIQIKQEKLAQIVATDAQTGLPNRLRFLSILKKETSKITQNPSRLSMAYIKIDNLSKINSLYGYKMGDKVIVTMAKILQKNTDSNHILSRMFGSGFVLLMPNCSIKAANVISKKMLLTVRDYNKLSFQLTCSIGVGEYNLGEENDAFIQRIESLMDGVSKNGGNMIGGFQ